MSWGINYPCDYCQRRDQGCKDVDRISEGVQNAHGHKACLAGEHLGGGTVIMACCNLLPYPKPAPPEKKQSDEGPQHPPKIIDKPWA